VLRERFVVGADDAFLYTRAPMPFPNHPRAVVTGAASGLGRALCIDLAGRGAQIVVADLDLHGAEETAQRVVEAGGCAEVMRCDVSKADEVEALAGFAQQRFGGTDLLVNNAGVAVAGATGEVPLSDWAWALNINLWGVIHGCHSFVPRFKAQCSGHILNVASAAGFLSAPELGPYNASKAAVISLSETVFGELRPLGIGVTVLCPTFFRTNIARGGRSQQPRFEQHASAMMAKSKLQATDVARAALDACQSDNLYCVPMADGQWAWRIKRLAPESFFKLLPSAVRAAGRLRLPSSV
jgi:NAD(P)-dependent dehydrogenase (short-subunit alcohol dehydrogenase family)